MYLEVGRFRSIQPIWNTSNTDWISEFFPQRFLLENRAIILPQKTGRSCVFFFFVRIFFEDAGSVITMSLCLPQNFGFWPLLKKVFGKMLENMCVTCYQFFWIFEGLGGSFKSVPKKPLLEVDDSPLDVVGAESAGSDDCAPEGRHMLPPLYLGFEQEIGDLTKTSVWRLVCLILSGWIVVCSLATLWYWGSDWLVARDDVFSY